MLTWAEVMLSLRLIIDNKCIDFRSPPAAWTPAHCSPGRRSQTGAPSSVTTYPGGITAAASADYLVTAFRDISEILAENHNATGAYRASSDQVASASLVGAMRPLAYLGKGYPGTGYEEPFPISCGLIIEVLCLYPVQPCLFPSLQ
jgi:hypothetical protein